MENHDHWTSGVDNSGNGTTYAFTGTTYYSQWPQPLMNHVHPNGYGNGYAATGASYYQRGQPPMNGSTTATYYPQGQPPMNPIVFNPMGDNNGYAATAYPYYQDPLQRPNNLHAASTSTDQQHLSTQALDESIKSAVQKNFLEEKENMRKEIMQDVKKEYDAKIQTLEAHADASDLYMKNLHQIVKETRENTTIGEVVKIVRKELAFSFQVIWYPELLPEGQGIIELYEIKNLPNYETLCERSTPPEALPLDTVEKLSDVLEKIAKPRNIQNHGYGENELPESKNVVINAVESTFPANYEKGPKLKKRLKKRIDIRIGYKRDRNEAFEPLKSPPKRPKKECPLFSPVKPIAKGWMLPSKAPP